CASRCYGISCMKQLIPSTVRRMKQLIPPSATTGLDLVRAVQRGGAPVPGIARLLGFILTRVDAGDVEAVLETRDDMTNPMGTVHGGIAATLLDTVMGCAVHTVLDAGEGYTTTDLQVRYVR